MRLIGYYIVHTVINSIKKLFRTWVAVFLGIVLLFGVIGGVFGVLLGSMLEDTADMPGSSYTEEAAEEAEETPASPEETAQTARILEAAAGVIVLALLLFGLYSADKSGSRIFTMPDVNFLFSAPLKPQSVLLFRLILQMGTMLLASAYLLFQLPNLTFNLGLRPFSALAIVLCWGLALLLGKLLTVFVYTLAATHAWVRRFLHPFVLGVTAALLAAVALVSRRGGISLWEAALRVFGSAPGRLVPGFGWLQGIVGYALEGRIGPSLLCVLGVLLLTVLLIRLTWGMKADFYEDALSHAAELQEAQQAAGENRTARRKKDRSDRLRRDGLNRGEGAVMFLYKGLYNRHRFARLRVFTGTGLTYFGVFLLAAVLILYASGRTAEGCGTLLAVPAAIVLFVAFFRNMGNPLETDMRMPYLRLVPESAFKKLLYAVLAGTYDTAMDVLPGLVIAALLLGTGWWQALGWFLLIVTLDFLLAAAGVFLRTLLPSSLPAAVNTMLLMVLRMLLLVPPLIVLLVPALSGRLTAGLYGAAALHAGMGLLCFIPAQALFHEGES